MTLERQARMQQRSHLSRSRHRCNHGIHDTTAGQPRHENRARQVHACLDRWRRDTERRRLTEPHRPEALCHDRNSAVESRGGSTPLAFREVMRIASEPIAFALETERLSLRLRDADAASWTLDLRSEKGDGTTVTLLEAIQRLVAPPAREPPAEGTGELRGCGPRAFAHSSRGGFDTVAGRPAQPEVVTAEDPTRRTPSASASPAG